MRIIDKLTEFFHRKDIAHKKALGAMFCNYEEENCKITELGKDFMFKVVSDDKKRYVFLCEKEGMKYSDATWERFSSKSPTVEKLSIQCDLFDVDYEMCYKVILEWIDGKK